MSGGKWVDVGGGHPHQPNPIPLETPPAEELQTCVRSNNLALAQDHSCEVRENNFPIIGWVWGEFRGPDVSNMRGMCGH